jgi:hypothetical protein
MHVTFAFLPIQHGLHEVAQLTRRELRALDVGGQAAISIDQREVRYRLSNTSAATAAAAALSLSRSFNR